MQRPDGRTKGAMRPVKITTDYTMYAEGSVLVEMGNTKVICTASTGRTIGSRRTPDFKSQRFNSEPRRCESLRGF